MKIRKLKEALESIEEGTTAFLGHEDEVKKAWEIVHEILD